MADQGTSGFKRIYNASRYSYAGLKAAFINEAAFRQELALMLILAPVAFWLGEGAIEKALLISSLLLVLIVELINSAIENAIDRIGPELHQLSGRAKDMASAGVLLCHVMIATAWITIAWANLL